MSEVIKRCMNCAFADLPQRMEPCKGCYMKSNWQPETLPLDTQRAAEDAMYLPAAWFRPGDPPEQLKPPMPPQAAPLDSLDAMEGAEAPAEPAALTGGSSGYYKAEIADPTTPGTAPYVAECNDIIEALKMDYALGNIFKAVWRIAKARMGSGKTGTTTLYDAEKVAFFGNRLVTMEKAK